MASSGELGNNVFKCPAVDCQNSFSRLYNLNRHYERFHLNNTLAEKCLLCGQIYSSCEELQRHYRKNHKPTKKFVLKESAFRKAVVTYRYTFESNNFDFKNAQLKALPAIKELLVLEASKKTLIKVGMIYICEMSMLDHVGEKMNTTLIPFRVPAFLANGYSKQGIQQNILKSFMLQEREMEEFCNCGSNWVFDRAIAFDVEVAAMRPILIGSNGSETESVSETDDEGTTTPEKDEKKSEFYDSKHVPSFNLRDFKNSKFLFNPSNKDEKCFLHCIHQHMKTKKPSKFAKTTFKMFEKNLNLASISFPISIHDVKKFCKQNEHLHLKINILLRNTDKHLFPLEYGLGETNSTNIVNLLLLQRNIKPENTVQNHFILITDINKFTRKTYTNNRYENSFLCVNCFNKFSSQKMLDKHSEICCLHKPRIEKCNTEKQSHIQFENYQNQHPLEYIAFLDFECVLPKVASRCPECTHLRCKCDRSFTEPMTEQYPVTYSLVILDQTGKIIHEKTYSSENAADHLIEHLLDQEEKWICNLFKDVKAINMSKRDWKNFHDTQNCYLCLKPFENEKEVVKCRDHCHFTGSYLGAACQGCNLRRQRPRKLHIYLHNGSKYDFHFIVKALNNKQNVKNINILPYNGENFRTISFNSFLFVDSMSFLQSSLAKLSEDLAKTDNSYSILRQTYLVKQRKNSNRQVFSQKKFNLVLGKSFFPYEFW